MIDSNPKVVFASETIEITSNYVEVFNGSVEVIEELNREKSRLQGQFVKAVQGVIVAFNSSAEPAGSAGHSVKICQDVPRREAPCGVSRAQGTPLKVPPRRRVARQRRNLQC